MTIYIYAFQKLHGCYNGMRNVLLWNHARVGIRVLPHGTSLGVIVGRVWIQISQVLTRSKEETNNNYEQHYRKCTYGSCND